MHVDVHCCNTRPPPSYCYQSVPVHSSRTPSITIINNNNNCIHIHMLERVYVSHVHYRHTHYTLTSSMLDSSCQVSTSSTSRAWHNSVIATLPDVVRMGIVVTTWCLFICM